MDEIVCAYRWKIVFFYQRNRPTVWQLNYPTTKSTIWIVPHPYGTYLQRNKKKVQCPPPFSLRRSRQIVEGEDFFFGWWWWTSLLKTQFKFVSLWISHPYFFFGVRSVVYANQPFFSPPPDFPPNKAIHMVDFCNNMPPPRPPPLKKSFKLPIFTPAAAAALTRQHGPLWVRHAVFMSFC